MAALASTTSPATCMARQPTGGLDITLTGKSWRGQGLNAETTNGGVTLKIPEHYAAHLETGTVNGGISVNFPITIQGDIKNRLNTDLNGGGPTIHAETTNGGVEIERAGGTESSGDPPDGVS